MKQVELLATNIGDSWWDETIRLYAAQSDATPLIQAALTNPTVISMHLAFDCQKEGLSIDPHIRKQLEEQLVAGLESGNPDIERLAAEVKLAQRLNNLLRIDEKRAIDNDLISCAEYQLFIDAMQKEGKAYQPDHWVTKKFKDGQASQPIAGLRAKDAEAFCQWLTQYHGSEDVQYRILNAKEHLEHPLASDDMGYWCSQHENFQLLGLKIYPTSDSYPNPNLSQVINRHADLDFDLALERVFALDLSRDRTLALEDEGGDDLIFSLDLARTLAYALALALGFASSRAFALNFSRDPDRSHTLDIDLNRNLVSDLIRVNHLIIDPDSGHDRATNFAHIGSLVRDLNLDLVRDHVSDRDLIKRILSLIRIQILLEDYIYSSISQIFKDNKIIFQRVNKKQIYFQDIFQKQQCILTEIYTFLTHLEKRKSGELPAWESLRIIQDWNRGEER